MKTTNFIHHLFLSALVVVLGSCVPKATENKAVCGTNQSFNSVSRTCVSIVALRTRPTGTLTSATLSQETAKTLTLSYKDGNSDTALSCKIISSSISSNIEPVSPQAISGVTDSAVILKAYTLLAKISALGAALPVGMEKTNLLGTYIPAMQSAYSNAKATFTYSNLISQLQTISDNTDSSLNDANSYTVSSASIRSVYNAAQTAFTDFKASKTSVENRCDCSGGVCTTTVAPRILQTGSAGFSYTITDVDGEGDARPVNLTIAATAKSATYLAPAVESRYLDETNGFVESPTNTPGTYGFTLPTARDYFGTTGFSYTVVTAPTKGTVTGCFGGSTSTSCIYTPYSGDTYDSNVVGVKATTTTTDGLTYTAKAEGTFANNFTIQYFDLANNNTGIDSYVTKPESYGLVSQSYSDVFVRVVGNAIKVFLVNGITKTSDIQNAINNDMKAKSMVVVSGGNATTPDPSLVTPSAISLAGGVDSFDSITFKVSNGSASSSNTATVMMRMKPTDHAPLSPDQYKVAYIPSVLPMPAVTFLESSTTPIQVKLPYSDSNIYFDGIKPLTCSVDFATSLGIQAAPLAICTCDNDPTHIATVGTCSIDVVPTPYYNGNLQFYYTITTTDKYSASTLTTNPQAYPITVTPVNDVPVIGAYPPVTTIQENSTASPHSGYIDVPVGPGGGGFEKTQSLSLTVESMDTTVVPNTPCQGYTPGAGAPSGTPSAPNILYFDTVGKACYKANAAGTAWVLYPSLTAFPLCNYYPGYYGSTAPAITPGAAGRRYLDTMANKCYISTGTTSSSWALDDSQGVTDFYVAFVPIANQSSAGGLTIRMTLKDSGGTANGGVDTSAISTFNLVVTPVNDPPYFKTAPTVADTNEGGMVVVGPFVVDEDQGSSLDENSDTIQITAITSDNHSVLADAAPTYTASAIKIFYDNNDNGIEDSLEKRDLDIDLDAAGVDSSKHAFYLKLYPVAGVSGNANVTITLGDYDGTTHLQLHTITTTFSLVVHPIAALHGGWANINARGIKTDKSGNPASSSDIQCNNDTGAGYCGGLSGCTAGYTPSGAITPSAANLIFWDNKNYQCYRSTSTNANSWVSFNTTCPVQKTAGFCGGVNCINPGTIPTPTAVGQYYYKTTTNTCYVSTGLTTSDWAVFNPSKVTLTWNSFTVAGSGSESGVSVAGWNVYRREAGTDYDFINGFLNPVLNTNTNTKMTITDPNVRSFTDTTAVAGKVYYYLVRPVDTTSRHLTISTPEIFSEVRVFAPTSNYAFVHRWMANQEVCNSMHMTTSTTNKVDPSHNYRCPYKGPGEGTGANAGYYDIGKDMLVDISESGCPYTPAPECTANGCIGIGDPTTVASGATDGDIYYDRSAGSCYIYNGLAWKDFNSIHSTLVGAIGPGDASFTVASGAGFSINGGMVKIDDEEMSYTISGTTLTVGRGANGTTAAAHANGSVVSWIVPGKTNSALNAPLANISEAKASAMCGGRSIASATFGLSVHPSAVLPTKKEFIAYSAAPYLMTDSLISDLEQGFSLNAQSRCNSSNANGLENAFTDSNIPSTSFIYTLPGTSSSSIRSLYTGSVPWGSDFSTETCSSRYGIQDVYGNVAEWVQDGMSCPTISPSTTVKTMSAVGDTTLDVNSTAGFPTYGTLKVGSEVARYKVNGAKFTVTALTVVHNVGDVVSFDSKYTCTTLAGTDLGDYDFATGTKVAGINYAFDLVTGPLNDIDANSLSTSGDGYLTNWVFRDEFFNAGKFIFPLGMPANTDIGTAIPSSPALTNLLNIGPTAGITTAQLHDDGITINGAAVNASATKTGHFVQGGSFRSGNLAGRYTSELIPDTTVGADIGFRCYIPVDPTNYPSDTFHPYINY